MYSVKQNRHSKANLYKQKQLITGKWIIELKKMYSVDQCSPMR